MTLFATIGCIHRGRGGSSTVMHPPLLVVGHDELRLQATRDALDFGRLLNPVVACRDASEAAHCLQVPAPEACAGEHRLPAVVLTELHLPDGSGLDVLRLVRSHLSLRRTPVIVIAEDAEDHEIDAVHAHGATAFLDRSVAADVLLGVIRDTGTPWALGSYADTAGRREHRRPQEVDA